MAAGIDGFPGCEHLDQTISVHYGPHVLGRYDSAGQILRRPLERNPRRHTDRRWIMKADADRDRQSEERKKNQKRKKGAAA